MRCSSAVGSVAEVGCHSVDVFCFFHEYGFFTFVCLAYDVIVVATEDPWFV